ncbi:S8 family serine peptidase [Streptomyces sp. NPDC019990]|uniref:S8 family serine peptidase n=1 Tax=Streptomyces sp. NPDC019990 TaxID=3154693 RepID=UPI0033F9C30C
MASVGAVDNKGNLWGKSNIGKGLTLVSPGVEIASEDTNRSDGYSLSSGTSDATAYVSAASALVRPKYPRIRLRHPPPQQGPHDGHPQGPQGRPFGATSVECRVKNRQREGNAVGSNSTDSSGRLPIPFISGGVAALAVIVGIILAVMRSRGNGGNGAPGFGGGNASYGAGYLPQPPMRDQQYPNTAGFNQGYPTPPGHSLQNTNPYAQQPPSQDR